MAPETHVIDMVDPQPSMDELALIDDPGSIWLSLGLVEMSEQDSEGAEGANPQRDMATGLLPLRQARAQDSESGESKSHDWSTESGFSTDVSENNKRRRANPTPLLGKW